MLALPKYRVHGSLLQRPLALPLVLLEVAKPSSVAAAPTSPGPGSTRSSLSSSEQSVATYGRAPRTSSGAAKLWPKTFCRVGLFG